MTNDEKSCPLCQQQNLCGVNSNEPCWCTTASIDKRLLAKVPKTHIKKSCICAQCIEAFNTVEAINKS